MPDDATPVHCSACDESVRLVRRPSSRLDVTCGCPERGIDVTHAVGPSTLFDPFTGHWSTLDD